MWSIGRRLWIVNHANQSMQVLLVSLQGNMLGRERQTSVIRSEENGQELDLRNRRFILSRQELGEKVDCLLSCIAYRRVEGGSVTG